MAEHDRLAGSPILVVYRGAVFGGEHACPVSRSCEVKCWHLRATTLRVTIIVLSASRIANRVGQN
jgi:hypothetical protein